MQRTKIKVLLGFVNIIVTFGVFYFAFKYGQDLIRDIEFGLLDNRYWIFLITVILFFLFYYILSIHWLRVCRVVDRSSKDKQKLAFFASQPYKYLPTSLFTFSYRAKYANKAGLTLKKSSLAQLIENTNIFISGFLIAGLFYVIAWQPNITILIVISLSIVIYFLPDEVVLNIKQRKVKLSTKEFLLNIAIASTAWIIAGLAFLTVNYALGLTVSPWIAIAANSLACVVGILAFFAPGGIGFRELTFVFFSIAGSVIVIWRLITFVLDLLFGLVAILALTYKSNNKSLS